MGDKINDSHRLILERRKKLETLKENGNNYLNNYPTGESCQIIKEKSLQNNIIDNKDAIFVIKGRMMSKRVMGKSSFASIKDETGSIQFYVDKKDVPTSLLTRFECEA